jgi:hypothetical protein
MIDQEISHNLDSFSLATSCICDADEVKDKLVHKNHWIVLSQNIRSLHCNFAQIEILIAGLKMDIDMIVLTECWLKNSPAPPSLQQYNCYYTLNCRTQNEGVAIYIKKPILADIIEPPFIDANCLVAKLPNSSCIIAIYRPPSHQNIDNFLKSLSDTIDSLKSFKYIYITGDININILENNNHSNDYLNLLAYHGFLPGHMIPTRNQSCLDHIIVKSNYQISTAVIRTTITDHYSTIFSIHKTKPSPVPVRTFKTINYDSVNIKLQETDFQSILMCKDTNKATELMISKITNIINSNTINKIISNRKRIIQPWITPGLLRCIRNRDRLHAKSKKYPDDLAITTTYKRYRNSCNDLIKKVQREYNKDKLDKARNDIKKTWKAIKDIAGLENKVSEHFNDLLQVKDNPVASLNYVNEYFANIGKTLADKIPMSTNRINPSTVSCSNMLSSFVLADTDFAEVYDTIKSLKNSSAAGIDSIPTNVVKMAPHILVPLITHICNLSFKQGIFPNILKTALITPVFKAGDRASVGNYRPISILPTISKVLERILNKRLTKYLYKFEIISNNQYGFIKGKSTELAVNNLTSHIVQKLEKNNKCLAVFLDLAKAFDTVSIPLLLDKLERIGVRGVALNLFKSYLSNRNQRVKVGDLTSDIYPLSYGVPQGSVLGPSLFLIYVNDLCNLELPNARIFAFADDTAIVFHSTSWLELKKSVEEGLGSFMVSLQESLLSLNLSKTKYITFTKLGRYQPKNYQIKAHTCMSYNNASCTCLTLERINTVKYLGIYLDSILSWKHHTEVLTNRTRKLIFIFKRLRTVASSKLIKSTYLALCQSLIAYCITTWGGTFKTYMINIERAQRAVLKIMLSKPYRYSTSQLYSDANVLTVRQLFILHSILYTHSQNIYDRNIFESNRQKGIILKSRLKFSPFAKRQQIFLGQYLYNKLNRILNIYPMTRYKTKKITMKLKI